MPGDHSVSGIKISSFDTAQNIKTSDLITGLQDRENKNFTFGTILAWFRQTIEDFYIAVSEKGRANGVASLDNAGKVTDTQIPFSSNNPLMDGTASAGTATTLSRSDHRHPSDTSKISASEKGVAGGVASLGSDGKVPSAQLPTIPSASSATPQNLGTAAAGSSTDYSRADHVHNKPSAADVGAQPTITASGILKGDGAGGVSAATAGTDYQVPLTFDNTPTANSANPVKSGGVYTDVRTRVPNYGMGVNLLRNWYFVGGGTGRGVFPVNQRGQSSYSGTTSVFDGWTADANTSITFGSAGITVSLLSGSSTNIYQRAGKAPLGQSITMSILTGNGLVAVSGVMPSTLPSSNQTVLTVGTSADGYRFRLYLQPAGTMYVEYRAYTTQTWVAAKLELGSEQTLAHQENGVWVLNEVPDYEEELIKCQTSTADPSDTYANKSLATEQQLAYVESGTTASRNYAVGEYFCWNGLLYRVKTAISSGASFTENTNCEQVTDGGLNNVGFIDISSYIRVNQSRLNNAKIKARYYPGSKKVELQAEGTVATTLSAGQNTLFLAASPYAPPSGEQQFAGCGVKNSQTPVAVWANSASINVQHGGASVGDKIAISLSWLLG